ncbi:MAG: ABC transporter permease, partial [Pyrinomonadaceae bacterium]
LVTALLCGLIPALQSARFDLQEALKEGGRRASGGVTRGRIFGALVIAEMALALVLLVGAGLLARSFLRLRGVETGIETANVLTVEINLPSARYGGEDWKAQRLNFYGPVLERIKALPGVVAAGAIDSLPLSGDGRGWTFRKEGQTLAPAERPVAGFQVATTDYFRAMGIPVRRGRAFTAADADGAPPVMLINESFARRFYPNEDPLGRRIIIRNQPQACEIVGVVNDVRHFGPHQPAAPEMYVPYQQFAIGAVPLVVRTELEPQALIGAVRREIHAVDREVAISEVRTMTQMMSAALAERRFALLLLSIFAAVALALAAVGLYGVMAYAVAARTHEFGIRMALGAQTRDVLQLVFRQGVALAFIGVSVGLVASIALTRLIKSLLFGVSATDPLTFAGVALLLVAVALLACYVPARRATRVDPMVALRYE